MIKLTKKDLGGMRLNVTPNWLTNGHWAIRKSDVESGAEFTTSEIAAAVFKLKAYDVAVLPKGDDGPETIIKEAAHEALGATCAVKFERTGWAYTKPGARLEMVEYADAAGRKLYLDKVYADGMGGVFSRAVYGSDPLRPVYSHREMGGGYADKIEGLRAENIQIIVMPLRPPERAK